MSRGLTWFIGFILLIIISIGTLLFVVRSADGPMEILSGGPFRTGEVVTDVSDWSFLDEKMTVELQTMLPPRSRTMWLVVHENRPIVLSSFMNTAIGKMWKQWPKRVEEDNRAIIRSDGKLYHFTLERLGVDDETAAIIEKFNGKYGTPYTTADIAEGNSWLFELKQGS
ncbi:MAG: hypothetical protein ISP91_00700 [Pseudomonadales bacterium]|jgi:hypothetical protein|nr:hypothetical protein [Pseudomonadales bacterium]